MHLDTYCSINFMVSFYLFLLWLLEKFKLHSWLAFYFYWTVQSQMVSMVPADSKMCRLKSAR